MQTIRINWIDLTKSVAIFLVLWGHALNELMPHELHSNPAHLFIYSFHMPLFMLMSGLFAEKSFSNTILKLSKKKFQQLIIPSLSFGLIWYLFTIYKHGGSLQGLIMREINGFWFLKALFVNYIVTALCWKCGRWKWYIILLCWIFFLFLQRWGITVFKVGNMLPFFLLGILVKNKMQWLLRHKKMVFANSLIIFFILLHFFTTNYDFSTYFFQVLTINSCISYLYYLAISLAGSLMAITCCMWIDSLYGSTMLVSILTHIGSMTLGIYLWQKIVLEQGLPLFLQVDMSLGIYNYFFTPIIACISLSICYYLTLACGISKWMNWIFWWGQYPTK